MKIADTDLGNLRRTGGYMDGGSIGLYFDNGMLCIDNRIHSETKGKLYFGYPDEGFLIWGTKQANKILSDLITEIENLPTLMGPYSREEIIDNLAYQYNL